MSELSRSFLFTCFFIFHLFKISILTLFETQMLPSGGRCHKDIQNLPSSLGRLCSHCTVANQKKGEKRRLNGRNIVVTPHFSRHRYIVYCHFVKICNKSLVIEMFISPCYCLMVNYQWTDRLSGIGICQSSMYLSLLSWLLFMR